MFFSRKNITELTDEQLLASYRKDANPVYIGELYERYSYIVFGLCLKYLKNRDEAADATLSIFEKSMADLKVHEIKQFDHWIYVVAKNHCLGLFRSETVSRGRHEQYAYMQRQEKEEEVDDIQVHELKERGLRRLELALEQLNAPQQKCVKMFYLEDRSYTEISELTGMSYNEVKTHLQNGKRNLKLILSRA